MKKIFETIKPSLAHILKDPTNFLLAFAPVLIGLLAYYFLGINFYEYFMREGKAHIDTYIQSGSGWSSFVYYILAAILTVILFFAINWSFVIVVSIISSPFNDALSSRIQRKILGKESRKIEQTFWQSFKKIFWIMVNEFKKVIFIVLIGLFSLIFSYIPFLTPISLIISALLLSVQFLDYSWSRNDLSVGRCFGDIRKNVVPYLFSGFMFFLLIPIPVVNILVPPLATSYFTTLWVNLNKDKLLSESGD